MVHRRIIPVLLLKDRNLVKTIRFVEPKYVGDPINTVRIFNEKEVDEIIILDITASVNKKEPQFDLIEDIASECFMPLGYGGGIYTLKMVEKLFRIGIEKVAINSAAVWNPQIVRDAANNFGSQSMVVSLDVRKVGPDQYEVFTHSGTKGSGRDPLELALQMEDLGAGELLITSIDREGTRTGYDLGLIHRVSQQVTIPIIAAGGAGSDEDLRQAIKEAGAAAAAAGSHFVFQGKHRAVLISYPPRRVIEELSA